MRKLDIIIIGVLLLTVGMLVGMYYTISEDKESYNYDHYELRQSVWELEDQHRKLIYVLEKTLPSSESIGTLYEKYKQQERDYSSDEVVSAE